MLSQTMVQHLNAQLNRELYSAYFYLGLAAQAESMNLTGAAAWFFAKHGEEQAHALRFYRYLLDQGACIELSAVAAPEPVERRVLPMFERTLEHERGVTATINELIEYALVEKDHATQIFLQWFVTEQIEEEATVNDILGRLRLFGDQGQALLMIDTELSNLARQLTVAVQNAAAP
ncbi:ferritin [Caldichromatium japonicum]|uniref:Ferritin n=1 Tax=Caldichromatium japonicum TaxID=2699430 RepID=A0A6G7VDF3_9GAMM|nr:ferritin [Caldichromatium japonicum]QIK37915.1 ferritin [Caldichromatium japonicum]